MFREECEKLPLTGRDAYSQGVEMLIHHEENEEREGGIIGI